SVIAMTLTLAAGSAWAQTAIELKKELLPKLKKAQADGKDLGEAGQLYKEGDEALKAGQQEEAVDFFKKAQEACPRDGAARALPPPKLEFRGFYSDAPSVVCTTEEGDMADFSVSPAGEKFPIPKAADYAAEMRRLKKLTDKARKEGKEIVVVM